MSLARVMELLELNKGSTDFSELIVWALSRVSAISELDRVIAEVMAYHEEGSGGAP